MPAVLQGGDDLGKLRMLQSVQSVQSAARCALNAIDTAERGGLTPPEDITAAREFISRIVISLQENEDNDDDNHDETVQSTWDAAVAALDPPEGMTKLEEVAWTRKQKKALLDARLRECGKRAQGTATTKRAQADQLEWGRKVLAAATEMPPDSVILRAIQSMFTHAEPAGGLESEGSMHETIQMMLFPDLEELIKLLYPKVIGSGPPLIRAMKIVLQLQLTQKQKHTSLAHMVGDEEVKVWKGDTPGKVRALAPTHVVAAARRPRAPATTAAATGVTADPPPPPFPTSSGDQR